MKHLIHILALFVALSVLAGCNKQSEGYRMVYVSEDGSKKVEKIEAANDTDAVKQYKKIAASIIFGSLGKDEEIPYKDVYVLSPSGEKLNHNKELMKASAGDVEKMKKELDKATDAMKKLTELSEQYEQALEKGDKKLADSIKAEVDNLSIE